LGKLFNGLPPDAQEGMPKRDKNTRFFVDLVVAFGAK
jgi:hypothetical protein